VTYTLTEQAKTVLVDREIPLEWLECALNEPILCQPDPNDTLLETPLPIHSRIRRARAPGGGRSLS